MNGVEFKYSANYVLSGLGIAIRCADVRKVADNDYRLHIMYSMLDNGTPINIIAHTIYAKEICTDLILECIDYVVRVGRMRLYGCLHVAGKSPVLLQWIGTQYTAPVMLPSHVGSLMLSAVMDKDFIAIAPCPHPVPALGRERLTFQTCDYT